MPQKGLESVADLRKMDISLRELSQSFHVPKEIIVLERTLLLLILGTTVTKLDHVAGNERDHLLVGGGTRIHARRPPSVWAPGQAPPSRRRASD